MKIADRDFDQIADDRLDVSPDVADLGELGRLDLDERRVDESGHPAGDLGLADTGRSDHQNVLRLNLPPHLLRQQLPAIAIAQRDGDRPLRVDLADDVLVQFGHDLRGCQVLELRCSFAALAPASGCTGAT